MKSRRSRLTATFLTVTLFIIGASLATAFSAVAEDGSVGATDTGFATSTEIDQAAATTTDPPADATTTAEASPAATTEPASDSSPPPDPSPASPPAEEPPPAPLNTPAPPWHPAPARRTALPSRRPRMRRAPRSSLGGHTRRSGSTARFPIRLRPRSVFPPRSRADFRPPRRTPESVGHSYSPSSVRADTRDAFRPVAGYSTAWRAGWPGWTPAR
jgi:hypothetical protein